MRRFNASSKKLQLGTAWVLLVLAWGCEGRLLDPNLPGTVEPPTTNATLAFRLGGTGPELIADLAADPAGGVYVTGSFAGTTDFDPGSGVTALTSLGSSDGFLAKYSATGALDWVSRIGGAGTETITSLARDAAGNLYLGGHFSGSSDFDPGVGFQVLNSAGGEDGFVAKYSAAGQLLWARRFGGSNEDEVTDLAADATGNVYAVGGFSGQAHTLPATGSAIVSDGSAPDGFVLSLDPAGTVRWALPIGGIQEDAARAVSVTTAGSIIVAGRFRGSADFARNSAAVRLTAQGGADVFLASYSAAGVLQRVQRIGGVNDETVSAGGLSLDPQDGAALLGQFSGTVDFDPGAGNSPKTSLGSEDLFLARYDAGGAFTSVLTLGGQGTLTAARALADLDGSVLLTGSFAGAVDFDPAASARIVTSLGLGGATDAFVARYSAAGAFRWVSRFGEVTNLGDRLNSGLALALDRDGQVLVAGRFFGSPDFDPGSSALRLTSLGDADAFVVLLTASGTLATTP